MHRKNISHAEHQIIRMALEAFQKATGLVADELPPGPQTSNYPDTLVRFTFPNEEKKVWQFGAEIKATLTRANLGAAIGQLNLLRENRPMHLDGNLLITRYVTPQMADELKGKGVQFIDAAGNAYINNPPLLIFLKGNKPQTEVPGKTIRRALRPSGLQVLFVLLCKPELVSASYRAIADAANVALGTVGWVMTDLKEMGHLQDIGKKGRRLTHKEKLLDRWVEAYPDQLRPKKVIGRFTAANDNWWKGVQDIRGYEAYWGGETAAAMVTGFLKPEMVTVYVAGEPNRIILENKMRKDPKGNIEIVKIFWNAAEIHGKPGGVVPQLLIYADLMATGDPRNLETSKMIYEQHLVGLVREG